MKSNLAGKPKDDNRPLSEATDHLASAHALLRTLREKTKQVEEHHPELDEAIRKLEIALSILSLKTGALL